MKEQNKARIEARLGLSMLKLPYPLFLFDHTYGFEFFSFSGSIFELFSPS